MIKAFLKAVMVGTLAASWLPSIFTVFMALFSLDDPNARGFEAVKHFLLIALSPVLVALGFVLPSALAIGLPVTFVLRALHAERADIYTVIGLFAGPIVAMAVMFAFQLAGGLWLLVFSAIGGGFTAWHWGRYRERLVSAELE